MTPSEEDTSPGSGGWEEEPTAKEARERSREPEDERIGPFRLLEILGEGGMGTVYFAEQTQPIRRQVALKVIKVGMDTKEVVARFDAERQALAVMDHPNIARVFDAGATEAGRPYFVMELVRGMPIHQYCDWYKLTVRERLELLIPICQAVQHAHQKGVIHRDLKPSNVLVALQDGKPVAKIIDFGIAKAMGRSLTELTVHTRQDQVIGTPAYMSPEQAEMSGLDVDTRTDIYSLGVILYQLLAGELPFDPGQLAWPAIMVVLRDTEPPTPSRRFKALGQRREMIADRRRTDPSGLVRRLEGDLDWITMKAMDKDRNRRYETATGLADDLRRHLERQPVLARPPSAGYRARRFVQRHKLGVTAAAVGLLGLLAGATAATVGFVRATAAERQARAAEERALRDNVALAAVSDFLVDLFRGADPVATGGDALTARDLLDRGAERIQDKFEDQPEIRLRLLVTMGDIYREVGRYATADSLLQQAVALARGAGTLGDSLVHESLVQLALASMERGNFDRSETLLNEALALVDYDSLDVRPDLRRNLKARTLYYRGVLNYERGDLEPAAEDIQSALASLGDDDAARKLRIIANEALGVLAVRRGRYEDAEGPLSDALALKQELYGPAHLNTSITLHNLGVVYLRQERYEEADSFLLSALSIVETALGADHDRTAKILSDLGLSQHGQRRFRESKRNRERALRIFESSLGPTHPDVAGISVNLARDHYELGEYDEAERLFRRAERIWRDRGETPYSLGYSLSGQADVARARGRAAEALSLYSRATRVLEATVGPEDPGLRSVLRSHASLLRELGRDAEADSLEARAKSS